LFNIRSSAGAQAHRLAQHVLEWFDLTVSGPQLELGIGRRPEVDEKFLAAIVQFDRGDDLRVAPIQVFGEPENRRQDAYDGAHLWPERGVLLVRFLRG
jgi:hypothetical protein